MSTITQGVDHMAGTQQEQSGAARSAAAAREAIADKIARLVSDVKDDEQAQLILHLSEAYANLAAEPPRARAT